MAVLLAEELQTYEQKRDELLHRAKGKYALIKGNRVIEVFESEADAIHQGYKSFGNVPFLVKEIVEVEVPLSFASNMLGI